MKMSIRLLGKNNFNRDFTALINSRMEDGNPRSLITIPALGADSMKTTTVHVMLGIQSLHVDIITLLSFGEAYEKKQIILPPDPSTKSICPHIFDLLLNQLMNQEWVVYAKAPFAGPEHLLKYLARYTHKIAISNHRILSCDEQYVTFKWRDYSDDNKEKIMKLEAWEFIRRFLSHVLPHGFMRIRAFGFLANACKAKKIVVLQEQLHYQPSKPAKQDTATRMLELTGKDITLCPICQQGKLKRINDIPAQINRVRYDTS